MWRRIFFGKIFFRVLFWRNKGKELSLEEWFLVADKLLRMPADKIRKKAAKLGFTFEYKSSHMGIIPHIGIIIVKKAQPIPGGLGWIMALAHKGADEVFLFADEKGDLRVARKLAQEAEIIGFFRFAEELPPPGSEEKKGWKKLLILEKFGRRSLFEEKPPFLRKDTPLPEKVLEKV